MVRPGLSALLLIFGSACGSKGAVSLVANAENPTLTVARAALGTSLSGGFELVIELGEYAEEGADVSLAGYGLHRGSEEIVSNLSLASDVDFPLRVNPGDERRVTLSIDMDDLLDSAVGEELCAGNVVYQGGITDGAGKLTPSFSAEFSPSCP